jgi:hypothetical protein
MRTRRTLRLAVMLALVLTALAVPAAAVAQSAGDDQYVDPFKNEGSHKGNSNSQGSDGNNGASQTAQTTTPTTAAPDPTASTGNGASLPRTGLPLGGLLVSGFALLGGGFTLRRRA